MDITLYPYSLAVFLFTIALSLYVMYLKNSLYGKLMLIPYAVDQYNEWYRFITSGFIHADIMHLGFNMMTFYYFAFRYESIVGGSQFLLVYFGSMIFADVVTYTKNKKNPRYAALGASGAISGLLFSFILYDPGMSLYIMFVPIAIPAPVFAVLYLLYSWYADKKSQDNINHNAHLWGALTGIAITILIDFPVLKSFLNYFFN
ncbi:rhomboid family intramembrane serine protease [bacterium]|nr:MAG: rhomboid family intramembrane serine protease [bacterium]